MPGGIFCIENWSSDLRSPDTVAPLLDFLGTRHHARVIHQRISTREELGIYLRRFTGLSSYQVAYLALHGKQGRVYVGNSALELEELVEWSNGSNGSNGDSGRSRAGAKRDWVIDLKGRALYLGSCGSLGVTRERMRHMREDTRAAVVCGYRADADWYAAASFEIMLLSTLVGSVDNRGRLDAALLADNVRRLRRVGGVFVEQTVGFVCEPDWRP